MGIWDHYRNNIFVAGGFLLLLLLLALFILWPNDNSVQTIQRNFVTEMETDRAKFFGEGAQIDFLIKEYDRANRNLERELARLDREVSRPFLQPLIGEAELSHRQAFVRESLHLLQNRLQQLADSRSILLSPQSQTMGLSFPKAYTETLETDLGWLAQMRATWDLLELLMVNSEELAQDGTVRHILAIHSVQSQSQVKVGPQPFFIQEIPIDLEIQISVDGLMRILEIFGRAESFHRLLYLRIDSQPQTRSLLVRESKPVVKDDATREQIRWAQHYYRVFLRVSRVSTFAPEVKPVQVTKDAPAAPLRAVAY